MPGFAEKREHERFEYDAPVMHAEIDADTFYTARMTNYSRTGMRLETSDALVSGADITVKMDENPLQLYDLSIYDDCRAQVKWCRELDAFSRFRFSVGLKYYLPIVEYTDDKVFTTDPECPRCQTDNSGNAELCTGCGYNFTKASRIVLADQPVPRSYTQETIANEILAARRTVDKNPIPVTMLFVNLTDFISISEQYNLQDLHQIMDGFFQILLKEVHDHRGTVLRFMEDGALAMFGAPLSQDAYATTACQAAISMQKALNAYGRRIKSTFGVNFRTAAGIHSGPVIMDAIGKDLGISCKAIGDTVQLAARMAGLADPDRIFVSTEVHHQAGRDFQFIHQGKMHVTGRDDSLHVYEIETNQTFP